MKESYNQFKYKLPGSDLALFKKVYKNETVHTR